MNPALGVAVPRFWQFEVTGLFDTGMFQYDNQFVVMSPRGGAAVHRAGRRGDRDRGPGGRSRSAPRVGEALEDRLGYPYRALDWQEQNSSLFSALKLEKLAMGLIIFFIMVVAAFNIVGTLTMVVTDKTREIGILEAMGLTPSGDRPDLPRPGRHHRRGRHGARTGRSGCAWPTSSTAPGWITIDPAVYFIDHLPVHVESLDVLGRGGRELRDRGARDDLPVAVGGRAHPGRSDPARMSAILEAASSGRPTGAATAADRGALRASTWRSPGASSSRSSARAARGRARCSTCWARWTPDRRRGAPRGRTYARALRRRRWPSSGTGRSASCFSSITCCGSSPRWRT